MEASMRPERLRLLGAVLLSMAITTLATAAGDAPRYIVGERSAARAALPFSDGVFVGDTLYLSGRLGLDPATGQAAKDPEAEIKLAMDGIQQTLKSSGLTMDDLVSVTVYCTDLSQYDKFNTVYKGYFHGKYPTRAFIGVASLLRGGRFEIQGVAVRSGAGH
jgi:2-iminobutanoate/2-iminopropanoate deaminase